jgi:hypothetical protein
MSWAFLIEAALAPVGLLVALVAVDHPVALTFVLPLLGLLFVFAHERQVRIDHALELSHAYRGTALLLGDVVEADDAYTGRTAATSSRSSSTSATGSASAAATRATPSSRRCCTTSARSRSRRRSSTSRASSPTTSSS